VEEIPVQKSDVVTGWHPPELQEQARNFRREMTPAEGLLWAELRDSRLGGLHFRRQQVIDNFIADFYCHAAGLVVEVDGEVHYTQVERDTARDSFLQGRGLLVLRFTNRQVMNGLRAVLSEIHAAALPRLAPADPSPPQTP
jgi:very-short-patch-repair endonuclease